jgi:hypothetical protein
LGLTFLFLLFLFLFDVFLPFLSHLVRFLSPFAQFVQIQPSDCVLPQLLLSQSFFLFFGDSLFLSLSLFVLHSQLLQFTFQFDFFLLPLQTFGFALGHFDFVLNSVADFPFDFLQQLLSFPNVVPLRRVRFPSFVDFTFDVLRHSFQHFPTDFREFDCQPFRVQSRRFASP